MDIGEWLRSLGLDRYEQAFRDNEIDLRVLPKLTADDLKELGVTAIGHRRLLLEAIAALSAEANPAASDAAPASATSPAGVEAERRQLTVMFCDLIGSTPLAARFDPEDLREIVGAYHRTVAATVGRFAGYVAKYMGDGVLVYFGYPQAHEDDVERAVRAGLAVIDAVAALDIPEPLGVRLGIASGLVVVGDLTGSGEAQERGVVGQTPNLAARLQALAQANTMVVADGTRRQLGALFEVEDLGPQPLAGFAEPQRAWRVLGESGVASRFEALRSEAAPLIGRDEEIELLLRRWHQAKASEGRVVLISGEPGIGKSRLAAALSQRIAGDPHTRLRYFCSPHHQDSALYPFIAQLERAAGFARDDSAARRLAKLEALIALIAPGGEEFALIAELLSLPNAAAELTLSPQRKRERLFEALLQQFDALARARPVLMVFEDAQWLDPTSHELLDLIVDRTRRMPVLLIVTFRPEFQPPWVGQPHVATMALNRLAEREGTALVMKLAGAAALDQELVAEIVERTDGVPLFVEELTKAVLESGGQRNRIAALLAAGPASTMAIPATLHASLIARLDRLGTSAKEVAQIGAVLGRGFSYELIQQVAERPQPEMQAALAQLADAGLLFCHGTPPLSSYLFKHALVQDAAYGTLLRARRQELHARVAGILRQHFADLVERQPELLAHHLTAAGRSVEAVEQWLKAGRHAAAGSAHREALAHFDRGLAVLASLPDTAARDREEVDLLLARGVSLFTAKGFASAEASEAYARAQDLCEKLGDADRLFAAQWGLWNVIRGTNFDAAHELSGKLLILTRQHDDDGLRLQAHHTAWTTSRYRGEPAVCREHCAEGRRLYDTERHGSHTLLYGGHDPGVCARWIGAWAEWLLGYPEKAKARLDEALAMADRLGHPFTRELALENAMVFYLWCGEPEAAERFLAAAETLVAEQRLAPVFEPLVLRGGLLTARGAADEAIAAIREGLAARQALGSRMYQPLNLFLLAQALERAADYKGALAASARALATAAETGEHWCDTEIHRLRGVCLLAGQNFAEGEACFREAIAIARRQQAKSLELRAATRLARLLGEQGRRAEARELLAPLYGWFNEGLNTADVQEAKALLAHLA